ncbi:tyrosine-type recombinase/integrase [Thermomonospora cellulosilytica]|uniref:Site-specific recombinase XerD n=1 Tax=Thermomonospora cellulosilytica TaxID=1411118 RepID=A0A7W3MXH1_9ACTN|nr:tyrosine-type recombinase/integrase [Thermomonospora cellulosilytica]MBA9003710.1 site-specific recombinase XerD [Thermomonospora cellulosilytica]
MSTPSQPPVAADLLDLLASWERELRIAKLSPATLRTYGRSVREFAAHLAALDDPPATVEDITREHVQDWIGGMVAAGRKGWTVNTRFANLRTFFYWLVDEGEMPANPMERMRQPKVEQEPVDVLTEDEVRAMLAACGGDFTGRRDEALIRAYADGGMRWSECANLKMSDVDMDQQVFWVLGKGGKTRAVPFGERTARALDRYLRARRRHPKAAGTDRLWVGRLGGLSAHGVRWALEERARKAGVENFHPHRLRHTAAHQLRKAGMNDQDMKRIFGWRSGKMLERYGESVADERAREAHRRLSFGDRL